MPFVTEELWQRLPRPHNNPSVTPTQPQQLPAPSNGSHTARHEHTSSSSIMMQPYPEPQEAWQNLEAEESMQAADHVIRAARKLRSDYGLQRQRPQLFIQVWLCAWLPENMHHAWLPGRFTKRVDDDLAQKRVQD